MSRWRYPFKTKSEAGSYLGEAQSETGKKHKVFPVTYRVRIYKIFPSRKEYQKYINQKQNKYLKPI